MGLASEVPSIVCSPPGNEKMVTKVDESMLNLDLWTVKRVGGQKEERAMNSH